MRARGGDLIELNTGEIGRVRSTIFSLAGSGTRYKLDTGAEVPEEAITNIIEHGRHEYSVGTERGHCARCGVAKKAHA